MRLEMDTQSLASALKLAAAIAPKSGTVPILSCVLLECGSGLCVSVFDGATGLTQRLQTNKDKPGKVAVTAKKLADIIGLLSGESVLLSVKNNQLIIESAESKFSIGCFNENEFPVLPTPSSENIETLPADILLEGLTAVAHTMKNESEDLSVLQSMHLVIGDTLCLRSTDGHRLTQYKTTGQGREAPLEAILPRKGVLDLIRLVSAGSTTDSWTICLGPSVATFSSSTQSMTMLLVSGDYPSVSRVLSVSAKNTVNVTRERLLNALKRVACVSPDAVDIQLEENRLSVSANTDIGEAEESIPVEYSGTSKQVRVNNKYAQQALDAIDADCVLIDIVGPTKPLRISLVNDSYKAVIMPITKLESTND